MASETKSFAIAAAAAVFATAGDLLMLWVGNATRPELGLASPPAGTLWLGAALGVFGIPLYAAGYRAASRALAPECSLARHIVAWTGGVFALVGAGIHGLTASMIADAIASGAAGDDPLAAVMAGGSLIVGLWVFATALMLAASLAFAFEVARGRSALPRAFALLNPLFATIALAFVGLSTEPLRAFLTPAAPNVAHVLFFAAAAFTSSSNAALRSSIKSQRSGTRSRHAINPKSR